MSVHMDGIDLLYNCVLLVVDAVVIAATLRWPRPRIFELAASGAALVAALLALLPSRDYFHLIRLYAFAVLLHVPLQHLAAAVVLRRARRGFALLSGLAGAAILLIAVDAYFIEPVWLQVEKITIESPRVTRPLRIAVVADLQTDMIGPYETRVLQRVVDEKPDLILFTGDYLHESDPRRYALLRRQLSTLLAQLDLSAPRGVFAVRGNVEHRDWPDLFPVQVTALTETTSLRFSELQLTGLDLWDSFDESLRVEAADRFHIVFGHAPDFALGEIQADLLIAGHTHGGQIRFPLIGPVLTFSQVPRGWAQGVTELTGGRKLVVSRGIGMERGHAPRLRLLCRPQLVFIDCVQPAD